MMASGSGLPTTCSLRLRVNSAGAPSLSRSEIRSTRRPGVIEARSSSSVSESWLRVCSVSRSSCSTLLMALAHLFAGYRRIASELVDGSAGCEIFHLQPVHTDQKQDKAD